MSDETRGSQLDVVGLTKSFGGTVALGDASLSIAPGRVHALLGSNGSGKSTLVKVLAGVHQADGDGSIRVGGRTVSAATITPSVSASLGLRFVHQQLGLFPQLSIADNFAATAGYGVRAVAGIDRRALHRRTEDMLRRFRIDARPGDRIDRLRPSVQTLVAIGRAMADSESSRVLVLDEPTESLPDDETARLLRSIRDLAADGMTFMIVSHRLAEIAEVADEATVLRDGVVVAQAPIQDLPREDLVRHITGGRPAESKPVARRRPVADPPLLEVEGLTVGSVRDLSFRLAAGEILGIAGLVGSGRSAVLEGLFGARPVRAGRIVLRGTEQHLRHPAEAIRAGIGLVPESRVAGGLFLEQSVARNISATTLHRFLRRGAIDTRAESRHGERRVAELSIRTTTSSAAISTLSGGNQQKAILARWLDTAPSLLLLDEPTQGVDVGARAEIHAVIRSAVADGMAVILVSSDLDELCDLSDRVLVLRRGRTAETIHRDPAVGQVASLMHEVS